MHYMFYRWLSCSWIRKHERINWIMEDKEGSCHINLINITCTSLCEHVYEYCIRQCCFETKFNCIDITEITVNLSYTICSRPSLYYLPHSKNKVPLIYLLHTRIVFFCTGCVFLSAVYIVYIFLLQRLLPVDLSRPFFLFCFVMFWDLIYWFLLIFEIYFSKCLRSHFSGGLDDFQSQHEDLCKSSLKAQEHKPLYSPTTPIIEPAIETATASEILPFLYLGRLKWNYPLSIFIFVRHCLILFKIRWRPYFVTVC